MKMTLLHGSFEPLIYMLMISAGIILMVWKAKHGMWFSFIIDIMIFTIIFKLHGSSVTGGIAATGAALICSSIIPLMFRRHT